MLPIVPRRLSWLLAAAPAALVVCVALKSIGEPVRPYDLWWHLAMGRLIAAGGAIPTTDAFSFTRSGATFFDQPWLAQLVFVVLHRKLGLEGLLAADFVVVIAALGLSMFAARQRGARLVSSALALL